MRSNKMFAFVRSIAVVALTFLIETFTQQLQGISTKVVAETLKKSPIAAGVTVAVELPRASPFTDKAIEIGSTVPPVAIAILPVKFTL